MKRVFVVMLSLLCVLLAFGLVACNNDGDGLRNEEGVVIEGGGFDKDCKVVLQVVSPEDDDGKEVIDAIADYEYDRTAEVRIFDIHVEKDGQKVQPDGKITVTIPVQLPQDNEYLVFHVKDDGEVETLVPIVEEGAIKVEISSFSYFIIAKKGIKHVHTYGEWKPSSDGVNHERTCACGEKEIRTHFWGNGMLDEATSTMTYTCRYCEATTTQQLGYVIAIAGGQATFAGKETVTKDTSEYGNANVYIAQKNDVLTVTLQPQEGRSFKYWVSATGTIISDETFKMLVLTNGYYYAVFDDSEESEYTNRTLVFAGNCEEGNLYMSTNAKNDIEYELVYVYYEHNLNGYVSADRDYHYCVCDNCGEGLYKEHEWDSEILLEATHTEKGLIQYTCDLCGEQYTEEIPTTEYHNVDYNEWTIVEESKNGNYGKYTVQCQYCDYTEEYWYLAADITAFTEGKYIHYHSVERGKETHNEYYYNYTNENNQKVHIFATQYQYVYSSNYDDGETYIFMYIDDEDDATLDPVYLSKSYGSNIGEYLWAIYGYVYNVYDWERVIAHLDIDAGCEGAMVLVTTMGARSSALYGWYDRWALVYNNMRIPTTKESDSFLESEDWQKTEEGIRLQGAYYDEALGRYEYIEGSGYESVTYQKGEYYTGSNEYSVDKNSGVCLYDGYRSPYFTHSNSFWEVKTIVSPEQYELLSDIEKITAYNYGDIENDIKAFCLNRNSFSNFTLDLPEETTHVRFLYSEMDVSGDDTSYYENYARVFAVGSPLTINGAKMEGYVVDYYEIWDFDSKQWKFFGNGGTTYTINTESNPFTDVVYMRAIIHETEAAMCTVTIEGGRVWYEGEEYIGTFQVPTGVTLYPASDDVPGYEFDYWLSSDGSRYTSSSVQVTENITITAVYKDKKYNISVCTYGEIGTVTVTDKDGNVVSGPNAWAGMHGEIGTVLTLTAFADTRAEYSAYATFLGWYRLAPGVHGGNKFYLIGTQTTLTYTITVADEQTNEILAVWTDGTVSLEKYADIRTTNGFTYVCLGTEMMDKDFKQTDNAFSCVRIDTQINVLFFDDPTDGVAYSKWEIKFKVDDGDEYQYIYAEDIDDEENGYYERARVYLENPEFVHYADNTIYVTGIVDIVEEEKE